MTDNEIARVSLQMIAVLLDSASPNPKDHPTMTRAWNKAKDFLEKTREEGWKLSGWMCPACHGQGDANFDQPDCPACPAAATLEPLFEKT
jgi:hypothetical protein